MTINLNKKLKELLLASNHLDFFSKKIDSLIKLSNDSSKVIKDVEHLKKYLKENNNDLKINIDSPINSKKDFGDGDVILPFNYGEFSDLINPADNMGWDIIFPPSEEVSNSNLKILGIIIVNPDRNLWKEKAGIEPPINNDKIIVSRKNYISADDKKIIDNFFKDMWQFKNILYF